MNTQRTINGVPVEVLQQHLIAVGKTGSGKSSKLRLFVEYLLQQGEPVTLIDPKGDWWGLKLTPEGKSSGYPVVIFGGEKADIPITPQAGAQIAEVICNGNRPSIIDISDMMINERATFFIDFASTLFRKNRGIRYLVIDEVHNFAPKAQNQMRGMTPKMLHWANRLASEGRGKGLRILAASQRTQKVHNDFLTSCETLIAGRVTHPSDRKAIKEWVDGCADPALGKAMMDGIASMERTGAWVWSPEILFGPEQIEFSLFDTYDSFKEQELEDVHALPGWGGVDIGDLTDQLQELITEQQSNDPVALKARIVELEKEIKKRANYIPKTQHTAEVARAVKEAVARVEKAGAGKNLAGAMGKLQTALDKIHKISSEVATLGQRPTPIVDGGTVNAVMRDMAKQATDARDTSKTGGELTGPQQRIVDSIAWWEQTGLSEPYSRVQVAFMADYSPKGSAFTNPLGKLRSTGYVEYVDGKLRLTDKGHDVANLPGSDMRCDAETLHKTILRKLTGPQRRILQPLLEAYPDKMSREQCAASAGYSAGGSAFSNPLGALRSLGLVEYPETGYAIAHEQLFPNG